MVVLACIVRQPGEAELPVFVVRWSKHNGAGVDWHEVSKLIVFNSPVATSHAGARSNRRCSTTGRQEPLRL